MLQRVEARVEGAEVDYQWLPSFFIFFSASNRLITIGFKRAATFFSFFSSQLSISGAWVDRSIFMTTEG